MEKSWSDGHRDISLVIEEGKYRMNIRDIQENFHMFFSKEQIGEIALFLKEYIEPNEKSAEKLADPNNPEDITAVEERYQNAAKTSDTLLGAIDMAKEMYKDKQKPVHVFSYDNARQIKQSTPYLSATLDCNPPEDYRPILSINLLNCDHSNEAIILRAL